MFDIGFLELLLIAVVALLVIGPERLPAVVKSLASWMAKARFFANNLKEEFEREANLGEMRAQLEAQQIQFKQELERVESKLRETDLKDKLDSSEAENSSRENSQK